MISKKLRNAIICKINKEVAGDVASLGIGDRESKEFVSNLAIRLENLGKDSKRTKREKRLDKMEEYLKKRLPEDIRITAAHFPYDDEYGVEVYRKINSNIFRKIYIDAKLYTNKNLIGVLRRIRKDIPIK